jgi:AcrR family transcriptional regulator
VLSICYTAHVAIEEGSRASAPATARARARAQLTREITDAARRQLAEVGADGLSLRAVARELGMASSAVYRYFRSRDELLTALIVEAYDAVGDAAERAALTAEGPAADRFVAVAVAIRRWAVEHPHDYALIYGSPVPGYSAPTDTVSPAVRVSLAALGVFTDGVAAGEVSTTTGPGRVHRSVRDAFARLRAEAGDSLSDDVLTRILLAWTAMFGTISFELFGHLHGMVEDYDAFFAHQMQHVARFAVHGDALT